MVSSFPFAPAELSAICRVAVAAGARIMEHFHDTPEAQYKADKTPVTQADRDAEDILTEGLRAIAPSVQIIGEESAEHGLPAQLEQDFFLLDPLDGTREFLKQSKNFTVNIGLVSKHRSIFGVIYAPAHNALYFTNADGAYHLPIAPNKNSASFTLDAARPIRVTPPPDAGLRVIASDGHRNKKTDALVAGLKISSDCGMGSSLKFCEMAAGRADFYPRYGRIMEWDVAAGHAILRAAGGEMTDLDGKEMRYGNLANALALDGFFASTQPDWRAYETA